MISSKIIRLIHTVKHLKCQQILYQTWYRFAPLRRASKPESTPTITNIKLVRFPAKNPSLTTDENYAVFTFLNISKSFSLRSFPWTCPEHGLLWEYNLHYCDWLNQRELTPDTKLRLLLSYYSSLNSRSNAIHPYPTSLRIINVAKFASNWKIQDENLNKELALDLVGLTSRLEFHLLANHLLENAIALFVGALVTRNAVLLKKSKKLLKSELEEQILADGMHFERSPMYHLVILERLLDAYNFASAFKDEYSEFLKYKCLVMTSLARNWEELDSIPMMQDSTHGIALPLPVLLAYAEELLQHDYPKTPTQFEDSNYRMLRSHCFSAFINVGSISPSYQPAHAHADELNFELYFQGSPIVVDSGISTYENGRLRETQRSTQSHNCVTIDNENSSDVWSSFRVGKRAKVCFSQNSNRIVARRTSLNNKDVVERKYEIYQNLFQLTDAVNCSTESVAIGRLHFHPTLTIVETGKNQFSIQDNDTSVATVELSQDARLRQEKYQYCLGYNKTTEATRLLYEFSSEIDVFFNFDL